jgi:hypothetical protein
MLRRIRKDEPPSDWPGQRTDETHFCFRSSLRSGRKAGSESFVGNYFTSEGGVQTTRGHTIVTARKSGLIHGCLLMNGRRKGNSPRLVKCRAFLWRHSSITLTQTFGTSKQLAERRTLAFAVPIAALALLLAGCVTEYYPYQGGGPMIGQGGAAKRIDGIDIWQIGAPPRKFQIIGFIEDTRPGSPPSMAQRDSALAAVAKQHGGDGVLIQSDVVQYAGSVTSGNAFTTFGAGSAFTTGSAISAPIVRREGRFFVIKYL